MNKIASITFSVCPLIQKYYYRNKPDFVVRTSNYSISQINQLAIDLLRKYGSIYVTGNLYSQRNRNQNFCFRGNTGVKKTSWIVQNLIPLLEESFGRVFYTNVETDVQIEEIMDGKHDEAAIRSFFNQLQIKIITAGQNSEVIILDECHWLFPPLSSETEDKQKLKIFRLDHFFAKQQIEIWAAIQTLRQQNKKIIFISWLHPQDISLSILCQDPDKSYYIGDVNFSMIFFSPVFEFVKPFEEDG
jgi:hypothetical protein